MLASAEALEAHDAGRPRAEAALALDPPYDRVGGEVVEPLELEAAAKADNGRAAPFVQSDPPQLERRDGGERGGRRRFAQTGGGHRTAL